MRRRAIGATCAVFSAGLAATGFVISTSTAGPTNVAPTPKERITQLQRHIKPFLSSDAVAVVGRKATFGSTRPEPDARAGTAGRAAAAAVAAAPATAAPANVRVNDPSTDGLLDQTTQSETTVAVAGSNVVVGFNDSQRFNPAGFTAAANLTGYATSADGGKTFTDRGVIPNPPGGQNVGDPWVGADRAGTFYYSTLVQSSSGFFGSLGVGVARSTDGGRTFSTPVSLNPPGYDFYEGDKPALAVGRDPARSSQDDVYVAWDDFYNCDAVSCFNGLPVAHSTDGGATFTTVWAKTLPLPDFTTNDCSFGQYFGSQPVVDPRNGALHVFSIKIAVSDPMCDGVTGYSETFAQIETTSTDGGTTFGPEVTVGDLGAPPVDALLLEPGKAMRLAPFVTAAQRGSAMVAVWSDLGAPGNPGAYNLRLATSDNGGATWSRPRFITDGASDIVQPSLTVNRGGWHIAAYVRTGAGLAVTGFDSDDGERWATTAAVSSTSFPGVLNDPQFDPIIAPQYMGDYIGSVATSNHVLVAWGDNRGVVKNALWPSGRNDPDVYFAVR